MLKNIIIINDFSYINGGASRVALESAIGLSARQYKVIFFSAVKSSDSNDQPSDNLKFECLNQHEILLDPKRQRASIQGLWNLKAARSINKLLDSHKTSDTVVHIHSWTKALSSSVIRSVLKRGFSLVLTLHDYFSVCPNGTLFDFLSKKNCTLKPLSMSCIVRNCDMRRYSHKVWRCLRQSIQSVVGKMPYGINYFIFVSEFSRGILEKYLPEHIQGRLIKNPIDIELTEPVFPSDNRAFIYVGRLSEEKGVLTLARAFRGKDDKLIFVGDGNCRDEILRILPNVKITGWISSSSVIEYLRASRALVLPSAWYETQGMVVLEAAAQGVPAIVPDTCAAREFVRDGKTGLWFRGGDLDDLLEKINSLEDDNLVEMLGKEAYSSFWTNPPTLEKHTDELIDVYESILQEKKKCY